MSDIYNIKLTTNDGGEFKGQMSRRQPELVNGFVPLATETGQWLQHQALQVSLSKCHSLLN
ncbi:hypothetical protein ACTJN2_13005 [Citrobacter freundii]|uniref:hypothetical protein n=1 Tax=Citrobacter freundii TaxID=546 RepID=UPI0023B29121|nr:hypothetical protein [Citrobacter freundii]MDE9693255.1 hypothetical protein [Citrobacter freundii]MEB0808989.1 hypothetical protein [Citrobacter freundii]